MLEAVPIALDKIYVPAKRKRTLEPEKVQALAEKSAGIHRMLLKKLGFV